MPLFLMGRGNKEVDASLDLNPREHSHWRPELAAWCDGKCGHPYLFLQGRSEAQAAVFRDDDGRIVSANELA
jgi:hypothetical protein